MIISRPCIHPDCPPRDGFIRGQYESVEFIREVPQKPRMSSSMTNLPRRARTESESFDKDQAEQRVKGSSEPLPNGNPLTRTVAEDFVREGRKRGKTISFAQSRDFDETDRVVDDPYGQEEAEANPVEWIMITRSDPGGSVPRFMVERGTPGGIVADASKFLDWACKKDHPENEVETLEKKDTEHIKEKPRKDLEAYDTNGRLAGLEGSSEDVAPPIASITQRTILETASTQGAHKEEGLLSSMAGAAYASIETYAPQAVIDRLPGHQHSKSLTSIPESATAGDGTMNSPLSPILSDHSSIASFASAEDHFDGDDTLSTKSGTSRSKSLNSKEASGMSPHEKELLKLDNRKRQLNEKLKKAREKEMKDKESLTSKEEDRLRKAEDKHAKEIQKHEEKYKKEIAKLEAKRQKEAAKNEDRKKRAEDKDEKARLAREKEEMRQQLEVVSKERDILRDQVGALQRENTSLVVRLGKIEDGKDLLKEVKSELEGNRSRSSSLRGSRGPWEKGKEATVLGGEKEGIEGMRGRE